MSTSVTIPDPLENIRTILCLKEATGHEMPVEALLSYFRKLEFSSTFSMLAHLAAIIANSPGGIFGEEARLVTRSALVFSPGNSPIENAVREYILSAPATRAIAHEQVIYFAQAIALQECPTQGDVPSAALLAFLLLAANDHVHAWLTPDDGDALDLLDQGAADFSLLSLFNHGGDPLRQLVRTAVMIEQQPRINALSDPIQWEALQRSAFGASFSEYLDSFLGPAFTFANSWSMAQPLVVNPSSWFSQTDLAPGVGERWLAELTWTRDEARKLLSERQRPDGLPHSPTLFYWRPFVEVRPDVVVASSPWAVAQQLSVGLWGRLNAASKLSFGKNGNQIWSSTFGELFERWCRNLVAEAQSGGSFVGVPRLSSNIGDKSEIDDIVVLENNLLMLGSVKAKIFREESIKAARSRKEAIRELRSFLFESKAEGKAKGHRSGALWLLHDKVDLIRAGKYEPEVPRDVYILPVLIMFDHIGETPVLYKWIERECVQRGTLQQPGVLPLTIASSDDYESMMAFAYRGESVCTMLQEKTLGVWKYAPLQQYLLHLHPHIEDHRTPLAERWFEELGERTRERLFSRQLSSSPDEAE